MNKSIDIFVIYKLQCQIYSEGFEGTDQFIFVFGIDLFFKFALYKEHFINIAN